MFELLNKVAQELLVLAQLEVKHALQEHLEFEFILVCRSLTRLAPSLFGTLRCWRPLGAGVHGVWLHCLLHNFGQELLLEHLLILIIVHFLNNLSPLPALNEPVPRQDVLHNSQKGWLRLQWVFFTVKCTKQCNDCLLHSLLNEPELFITLAP